MKHFNRPSRGYDSYHSSINGILTHIQKDPRFKAGKDINIFMSKVSELMINYLKEKDLPHKDNKKYSSIDFNANVIQNDFKSFRNWIEENTNLNFNDAGN